MTNDIHKIHNYIRDYTKISNEDKSFFIACVIVALKKTSFIKIIQEYNSKKYIYDFIHQNLIEFEIDVSVFEFLRTDNNNKHFFNIINMINNIYKNNPSNDLLNEFYSEFVKYNNSDGKSLGIVLTPHHIVELMIKLLDIQEDDIFLDLCSGTGSFPIESLKYKPKNIIACEYQNKLYALLKCNMILRDVDTNNIIKSDCFDQSFKATKSAINPPYGMKDKKELDFIIKQLESIKEGGLVCAIIPKSKLNSNNVNNKLKKKLMELGVIKKIINCNPKLFYPSASIECCIILIKKKINKETRYKISLLDYSNDGIEIARNNGFIQSSNFKELFDNMLHCPNNSIIELKSDWCYEMDVGLPGVIDITRLELLKLEAKYNKEKQKLLDNPIIVKLEEYKEFKLSYLFDILKKPKEEYKKNGVVNVIAAKNNNNGVKCIDSANKNTFTGNKIVLVTGGNGGAGLAFYQEDDFNISSSTVVLSPKNIKLCKENGRIIAVILSKYKEKYSYSYQWNQSRIKRDVIPLPVKNGKINYEYLSNMNN